MGTPVDSIYTWVKKSNQPALDLARALAGFHARARLSDLGAAINSRHACAAPTLADVMALYDLLPAVAEAWEDGEAPSSARYLFPAALVYFGLPYDALPAGTTTAYIKATAAHAQAADVSMEEIRATAAAKADAETSAACERDDRRAAREREKAAKAEAGAVEKAAKAAQKKKDQAVAKRRAREAENEADAAELERERAETKKSRRERAKRGRGTPTKPAAAASPPPSGGRGDDKRARSLAGRVAGFGAKAVAALSPRRTRQRPGRRGDG